MRKNIVTVFIVLALLGISRVGFAEDFGACYIRAFDESNPKLKNIGCITRVTQSQCERWVNYINERTFREVSGAGKCEYYMERWLKNQSCPKKYQQL